MVQNDAGRCGGGPVYLFESSSQVSSLPWDGLGERKQGVRRNRDISMIVDAVFFI